MSVWRQPLVQGLTALTLVLALVVVWLLSGAGREPVWSQNTEPATDPATTALPVLPAPVALDSMANTWQTPLFSPTRQPDQAARTVRAGAADLGGLKLTGIVFAQGVRRALFKQADGRDLSLREGAKLGNGWRLQHIEQQAVQFELDGRTQRLQLPTPRLPNIKSVGPAGRPVPSASSAANGLAPPTAVVEGR